MKDTVGDELRWLFRAQSAGEITKREFEARKHELLAWSKCHFNQPLPSFLRRRR